jgi:hypothetical protein
MRCTRTRPQHRSGASSVDCSPGAVKSLGKPAQLATKYRVGLALPEGAKVLVGPGSAAVATDVPAQPVLAGPGPLEQPVGQQREHEHGRKGSKADPGDGSVRHRSSLDNSPSIAAAFEPRLCHGSPSPRGIHHLVRTTSAGRVDPRSLPLESRQRRAVQARAGRVAGRHQRRLAGRDDRCSARKLRTRRQRSARRPRSAWRCSARTVAMIGCCGGMVAPPSVVGCAVTDGRGKAPGHTSGQDPRCRPPTDPICGAQPTLRRAHTRAADLVSAGCCPLGGPGPAHGRGRRPPGGCAPQAS